MYTRRFSLQKRKAKKRGFAEKRSHIQRLGCGSRKTRDGSSVQEGIHRSQQHKTSQKAPSLMLSDARKSVSGLVLHGIGARCSFLSCPATECRSAV